MEFSSSIWNIDSEESNNNEYETTDDKNEELNIETDQNTSSSSLVLYRKNPITDVSILDRNFNLSKMPSNYMRRRSKKEEIVYRAVYSELCRKSAFASFKTANECITDLDKVNIITGINSLKSVIKSVYSQQEQISIVVHKVGNTLLLDEFEIDGWFHHNLQGDWQWLIDFIKQQRFQLVKPNVSRSCLVSKSLFGKFLYHSVCQPSITGPDSSIDTDLLSISTLMNAQNESDVTGETANTDNARTSPSQGSDFNSQSSKYKENFLNLLDWKLEDLSLIVGSDLSIFGTKTHPCISLRLSPNKEPINVLTGIDIWLENLLNEVPEVAMCYHDEGIIIGNYEIFQTSEIPNATGFDQNDVKSIAKNLSHFLSTNATKEGHTYWLFKEADTSMVKLYDLTNIWENEHLQKSCSNQDTNPFILPVAILCFRLAENRIRNWFKARDKLGGKSKLTSTKHNENMYNEKLADNHYYFLEIFRLLKNCINLLQKLNDTQQDLIQHAMMLMCRLYLEVDESTLQSLSVAFSQIDDNNSNSSTNTNISRIDFNVTDLKADLRSSGIDTQILLDNTASTKLTNKNICTILDENKSKSPKEMGTELFNLCSERRTEEVLDRALMLMSDSQNRSNNSNMLIAAPCVSLTLSSYGGSSLKGDKGGLLESVKEYFMNKCQDTADTQSLDWIRDGLKSGFLALLIDEEISVDESMDYVNKFNVRQVDFYYNLMTLFIKWHIEQYNVKWAHDNDHKTTMLLLELADHENGILNLVFTNRPKQLENSVLMLNCALMLEEKRCQLDTTNRVHVYWNYLCWYLFKLACWVSYLDKTTLSSRSRVLVRRFVPILLNLAVSALVNLYLLMLTNSEKTVDPVKYMEDWCHGTVLKYLEWTKNCINLYRNQLQNLDPNLAALIFSNEAKLFRLVSTILSQRSQQQLELYCYQAIECYDEAVKLLLARASSEKNKRLSLNYQGMAANLRSDRMDVAMKILETLYGYRYDDEEDDLEKNKKLKTAIEVSERILRNENSHPVVEDLKLKVTGLRLRLNFVRFYMKLTSKTNFNYEPILTDMNADLKLIASQSESLQRCQEVLLIIFYLTKIKDTRQSLSIQILRQYLLEDATNISNYLSDEYMKSYCNDSGKDKIKCILEHICSISFKFIEKSRRKKMNKHGHPKKSSNIEMINVLDNVVTQIKPGNMESESDYDKLMRLINILVKC